MRPIGLALALIAVVACSKSEPAAETAPPAKHEDRHEPAVAAAPMKLEVTIAGTPTTWQQAEFDKVARMAGKASDGEARDTWSLRELAHTLVGPTARVVRIVGAEGSQPLDPAAWSDATRTPIVHTTKKGKLKFRWADADGKWGETAVKDVVRVEIVR